MNSITYLCLFVSVFFAISSASGLSSTIYCYFESWTVYRPGNGKFDIDNIDPTLCTHICFTFLGVNEDGSINILDPWESNDDGGYQGFKRIVSLKNSHPHLKILVSMGGWNEGSAKYSKVAANETKRRTLVNSVLTFIEERNFDGFDLDWEYPARRDSDNPDDKENFMLLLKELKSVFHSKGLILSVAVTGAAKDIDTSYNVTELFNVVDFVNVMSYDFHGGSFDDYVGHNTPLYASHLDTTEEQRNWNVAAGIEAWIAKGANTTKMNMGIATYGRSYTLHDANNDTLYAPAIGGGLAGPYTRQEGVLGYNEICELYSDWTYVWDDEQKVPHRKSGDQWVGYDDQRSIEIKVRYAKSKNLGGFMVWSFDTDDFRGLCGNATYPLLRTISETLEKI